MNRTDRLLAIVLLLQSHRVIRAQDIADHFTISVRTVYRDLRALEEGGVPIAAEAGIGYSLVQGYNLPPVMFTHEEASALFTGAQFVERMTDKSLSKFAASAMLKIRAVLPREQQDFLRHLQNATHIAEDKYPAGDGFSHDSMTTIQAALVRNQVLEMEYYSGYRDTVTKRNLEPMALLYYSAHWHLIAFCRLRNDFRDFRVDRIKALQNKDSLFKTRTDFNLKDYLKKSTDMKNAIEVVVNFPLTMKNSISNKHMFGWAEEKVVENRIHVTFLVPELHWVRNWLLGFGTTITIIKPRALIEQIMHEAELLVEQNRKLLQSQNETSATQ